MGKAKRFAIYMAVSNNYDKIQSPSVIDEQADYFCFTDRYFWNRLTDASIWRQRRLPDARLDPVRMSRYAKLTPHLLFPDYEYSVFIDGNIDIVGSVSALLAEHGYPAMLAFQHPWRDCIYEEAEACIRGGKESPDLIRRQVSFYREAGFPSHFGLIESNVLVRRHHDPAVVALMDDWWTEIQRWSRRDQLSFPYVCWRRAVWPTLMGTSNARGSSGVFLMRSPLHNQAPKRPPLKSRLKTAFDAHVAWRFRKSL